MTSTIITDPAQDDVIGREDRGALICCHEPSYRDFLASDLRAHGLKIHHAPTHEAAVKRLTGRAYPLIVLLENLEGCPGLRQNPLWQHLVQLPTDERRQTCLVLLGQSFPTGDEASAYALSVDLLVNYADVAQLAELTAAVMEARHEADRHFREVLQELR